MLSAIHNRVNPFFDPRFLDKNQHEILMIRIVDYSVDSEAHRMLLAQAIVGSGQRYYWHQVRR